MKSIKKFTNNQIKVNKVKGGDYWQGTTASNGGYHDERNMTEGDGADKQDGKLYIC